MTDEDSQVMLWPMASAGSLKANMYLENKTV